MAPIQQSTSTRLTVNRASSPIEISRITHAGRAQRVLKCFARSGPIAVNTTLSPAWELYRMHGHMPADGKYYSWAYLGICMWKAKIICAVFPHCLGHPEHHPDISCLNFSGGKRSMYLSVSMRRKKTFHQLLCFLKVMLQVNSSNISVIIHQALMA